MEIVRDTCGWICILVGWFLGELPTIETWGDIAAIASAIGALMYAIYHGVLTYRTLKGKHEDDHKK